jgi:glycosyltransferase involved in cell wall biosynthesis
MKEAGKKIIMLIPSFYPNKMGGSEMQAFRLSKKLVAQGHEVFVFTIRTANLPKYENVEGINVIRVSGNLMIIPRGIQFLQAKFPFLQKKVKPDILEEYGKPNDTACFFLAGIFSSLCLKEIKRQGIKPSIVQINTVEWVSVSAALLAEKLKLPLLIKDSTVNGLGKLKMMPFIREYRQWIIENAFFVAISSVIKKELLAQGVSDERIFTISNGVEIKECLNKRDKVVPDTCLFVGNLYQEPAKGFRFLLDAWSLVVKEFKNAVLNVVGDGNINHYKRLVKAKQLENNVVFWGKQSDTERFYLSNEIFVLSSIREGMSNSLIEAMNYELPCVSTTVSGSTDLITNQKSGLLVEPKNARALADAISFLFANKHLQREIGMKAKGRVKQLCDIDVVSKQYNTVYEKLSQPNLTQV